MQFDKDLNSEFSEIFLALREILLKHNLEEKKRDNITSYFIDEGGICYLRTVKDKLIMGVFKGHILEDKYPLINGGQKVIRHLYFRSVEEIDKEMIENVINDSIILNIENREKRCKRKR